MAPDRLAAFTDGVLAIIITISVLGLKVPDTASVQSLWADAPILLTYAISFLSLGIFWNNHHHLFQLTENIDGRVLWTNLFALFWLSLVPFVVRWINERGLEPWPVAAFGAVIGLASVGYLLTEAAITACSERNRGVARALGRGWKSKLSTALYLAAAALALWRPLLAIAAYLVLTALWVIPDRRIERELWRDRSDGEQGSGPER